MHDNAEVLQERSSPLASFGSDVERSLTANLGGTQLLDMASSYLTSAGGKRARPWVCAQFGLLTNTPHDRLVDIAVAVELVHSASLMHDDIVDEAKLRRGIPSVNARYGDGVAVLAGDVLLSKALLCLHAYPHELSIASRVVEELSRAAWSEHQARGQISFALDAWRRMAEGKTGALFGLCGYSAASLSRAETWRPPDAALEERALRYGRIGRRLGVAFQMADDVHDLLIASSTTGKDVMQDLASGNPSYPILLAATLSNDVSDRADAIWKNPETSVSDLLVLRDAVLATNVVGLVDRSIRDEVRLATEEFGAEATSAPVRCILEWAEALTNALVAPSIHRAESPQTGAGG